MALLFWLYFFSGSCLKMTLKIGKNTQKEIAQLIILVTKSATVWPAPAPSAPSLRYGNRPCQVLAISRPPGATSAPQG